MSYKHNGYIMIKRPGLPGADNKGYVYEHRAVWQDHNGDISQGAVIHHIDGNKANNHISNLAMITSNAEHRRYEHGVTYEGKTIDEFDLIDMIFVYEHLPLDRVPSQR